MISLYESILDTDIDIVQDKAYASMSENAVVQALGLDSPFEHIDYNYNYDTNTISIGKEYFLHVTQNRQGVPSIQYRDRHNKYAYTPISELQQLCVGKIDKLKLDCNIIVSDRYGSSTSIYKLIKLSDINIVGKQHIIHLRSTDKTNQSDINNFIDIQTSRFDYVKLDRVNPAVSKKFNTTMISMIDVDMHSYFSPGDDTIKEILVANINNCLSNVLVVQHCSTLVSNAYLNNSRINLNRIKSIDQLLQFDQEDSSFGDTHRITMTEICAQLIKQNPSCKILVSLNDNKYSYIDMKGDKLISTPISGSIPWRKI